MASDPIPPPSDERKWWALQNRLGNVWSQIAVAPVTVSLFEFAEGRYWLGSGYLLLGFVLAFVVNNLMKDEQIKPAVMEATPRSYRYVGAVAILLTWVLCGVTVYVQLFVSTPKAISTPQTPPTMMDWNDVISLQDAIGTMQQSCLMKLTADSGGPAQNIRNIIRRTVTELKGCEIYDAKQDDNPDFSPNADATPTPKAAPGLIVRWNTDTESERLAGQSVFNALSRRFFATPGHKMPPNSPPNLIWIQVNGEPWK